MRHSFDTPWGRCALHWSPRGITRLEFPPARTGPDDLPPPHVARTAAAVRDYLGGGNADLDAELDFSGVTPFAQRVYRALQKTAPGCTVSYGELADLAGAPGAARAVGTALRRNPVPLLVPCHRVLASGGRIGGFSAPGGLGSKRRLLELEGWEAEKVRAVPGGRR